MSTEECSLCRFWMKRSDPTGELGGGYCRRFPPFFPSALRIWTVGEARNIADIEPSGGFLDDAWPNVHQQSWCGEFQSRERAG
ncbi:MAG: hypothetical protein E5Y15_23195 [Mesorhizobium sp.]|nr:MAG: hypothetical protein E5Y15_23195 [Mesorhizobium sp.]